ncbi:hypothetical protein [Clostridium botulinum]
MKNRLNEYFILILQTHITLSVCKKQKNAIKKSTNTSNAKKFVKALNNLVEVLPKNTVLTCVTHGKILKKIERNKNIKIIKIIKTPIEVPLIVEKLQIGNRSNLLEKEEIYYIKFIIKK